MTSAETIDVMYINWYVAETCKMRYVEYIENVIIWLASILIQKNGSALFFYLYTAYSLIYYSKYTKYKYRIWCAEERKNMQTSGMLMDVND